MIKRKSIGLIFLAIILAIMGSCDKILPKAPLDQDLLDGPVAGLSSAQTRQFLSGDRAFNNDVFTIDNGLGPLFVATSCGSCHAGDGKGHPFTTLTRFGQSDSSGNKFLGKGGPQLQHRALPGFEREKIPIGATFAKFMPPANTGLGFLELVSDADILSMSDPLDNNADGISGVPNWKALPTYLSPKNNSIAQNGKYMCRFGKKAGAFNLLHQTANAYNQDMGITSVFETFDTYTGLIIDPEVATQTVNDVVFYLQTLKAPIQRNTTYEAVIAGNSLFKSIGCENCHKQTLKTDFSDVEALSNKEFHPYTDLLLHDLGSGLDDSYTEGSAKTYEWRTPPLWGLGLSPNSQGGNYFLMHDGRAASIEQAIQMHGGEALESSKKYMNLTSSEKKELLKFLESL